MMTWLYDLTSICFQCHWLQVFLSGRQLGFQASASRPPLCGGLPEQIIGQLDNDQWYDGQGDYNVNPTLASSLISSVRVTMINDVIWWSGCQSDHNLNPTLASSRISSVRVTISSSKRALCFIKVSSYSDRTLSWCCRWWWWCFGFDGSSVLTHLCVLHSVDGLLESPNVNSQLVNDGPEALDVLGVFGHLLLEPCAVAIPGFQRSPIFSLTFKCHNSFTHTHTHTHLDSSLISSSLHLMTSPRFSFSTRSSLFSSWTIFDGVRSPGMFSTSSRISPMKAAQGLRLGMFPLWS